MDPVIQEFHQACIESMQVEMDLVMVGTVSATGSDPFDNASELIPQCQVVRQQWTAEGKTISDEQFLTAVVALAFHNYVPHTPFSERQAKHNG